jgi:hypothetical protein
MVKVRGLTVVALAVSLSGCWLQAGADSGKGGFNGLESAVTSANVAGLSTAWSVDVGAPPGEPLVSGSTAYVRSSGAVTALDLATGATRWLSVVGGSGEPAIVENALRVPSGGTTCTITSLALTDGASLGSRSFGFYGIAVPSPISSFCTTTDLLGLGTRVVTTAASGVETLAPHCGIVDATSDGISFLDFADTPQNVQTGQSHVGPCGGGGAPLPLPPEAVTAVGDLVIRPNAAQGSAQAYPASCSLSSCPVLWSVDTAPAWKGPVVALPGGDFAVGATDSTVVVVDSSTHAVAWTGATGAPLAQPVATDGTSIFALTTDDHVVAFPVGGCGASSCPPMWSATLAAPPAARASIGGDVVYIGSTDGTVTALAADGCGAATCPALWTGSVGAAVLAPPVIDAGTLLVGATDNSVTAFTLDG